MIAAFCFMLTADDGTSNAKIAELTKKISASPRDVEFLSERGDLHFQARDFKNALADYERMVVLQPKLDVAHWRKGIALYYLGRWKDSAKQFEKYQTIDDVDRENGLWRFMAMQKKDGIQKAREEMIQYTKMDRPPLTHVYRMFQGELTPDGFKEVVEKFKPDSKERFYADLYLGLYFDCEDKTEAAAKHFRAAEENRWAKSASGGPGWMWHIARIHNAEMKRLRKLQKDSRPESDASTKKAD